MSEAAGATIIAALIVFIGGLVTARYTFRQKAESSFSADKSSEVNLKNGILVSLRSTWRGKVNVIDGTWHLLIVGSAVYLLLRSKHSRPDQVTREKTSRLSACAVHQRR
jgi:Ca2+/Na+ antiporter